MEREPKFAAAAIFTDLGEMFGAYRRRFPF
jgi:hypothetical protein